MTADDAAGANPYAAPKVDSGAGGRRPRAPAGLRISAGIILLVNALANLVAGAAYIGAGLVWSGAVDIRKAAEAQARKRGEAMEDEQRARLEEVLAAGKPSSANLLLAGLLRVVVAGASVAAAVFVFRAKRSGFVLLTGLLVGATEVIGNSLSSRVDLLTAAGVVAALLAVISAVSTLNREALARRAR